MYNLNLNNNLCTRCSKCFNDCPSKSIGLNEEGYPEIINDNCIRCQHCFAICPEGAISIFDLNPANSISVNEENRPTREQMEQLIKGRRSIRSYKKEDIPREEIDKLLDLAYHAPTGVNRQGISFKVIYNQDTMDIFKKQFYKAVEKSVTDSSQEEKHAFAGILKAYREKQKDILFRGAPHIFFAIGNEDTPIVHTDGVIAASYFELATAASGYGAVWNGYVTYAVNSIPGLKDLIKLKTGEVLCYTLCFGIPKISYARSVQRGKAIIEELTM